MKEHILRAENKADNFYQAYPLGNGTLGAIVYGSWPNEVIKLNHKELWLGPPAEESSHDRRGDLAEARRLIFAGEYRKAQDLIEEKLQGVWVQNYLPLGDLEIELEGFTPQKTERHLDIRDGISYVECFDGDHCLKSRQFISLPDSVFAMEIECTRAVDLHLNLQIPLKTLNRKGLSHELQVFAQCGDGYGENVPEGEHPFVYNGKGITYLNSIKVLDTDGKVESSDQGLRIKGMGRLTFIFSTLTGYRGFGRELEMREQTLASELNPLMEQAASKSFETLLENHLVDFHRQYDKIELTLKGDDSDTSIPTADRLLRYRENPRVDPSLAELYFNYGRYLLISSSREGSLPANLQGIWSKDLTAPWWGNWTLNINIEMNYWPAGMTGLSDPDLAMSRFVESLAESGAHTARDFYGMEGWCCHHNSDLWRRTRPVEGDACWAFWPLGGLWMTQHMWHHYCYTGDKAFLKDEAWPVMEGAVRFTLNWLVEDENGVLQAVPSTSPENTFYTAQKEKAAVCISSAMDISMIRELFTAFIQAAEELGFQSEIAAQAKEALEKLQPLRLGPDGCLLEWNEAFEEFEPGHRHFSPLYSVYPESAILTGDPAVKEGARKLFHRRLSSSLDHTGWGAAWVISLASRLDEPETAHEMLASLIGRSTTENLFSSHNLLHQDKNAALFQIDGNFGGTAGIMELLVRDLPGDLTLLPALPPSWKEGSIKGYQSKNGLSLDISWKDGILDSLSILSKKNQELTLHLPKLQKILLVKDQKFEWNA